MSTENPENGSHEPTQPGFSFNDKRRIDPETGEVRSTSHGSDSEKVVREGREHEEPEPTWATESQGEPDQGTDTGAEPVADASDLGVEIPADASGLEDLGEAPVDPATAQPEDGEQSETTAQPESDEAKRYLEDLQRLNAEYASYRRRAEREQDRAHHNGIAKVAEGLIPVLDEVKLAAENGDVTGPFETHVKKLTEALSKLGIVQFGEPGEVFNPDLHEALMQQPNPEVSEPTVFVVMQPGYRVGERTIRAARVGVHMPAE